MNFTSKNPGNDKTRTFKNGRTTPRALSPNALINRANELLRKFDIAIARIDRQMATSTNPAVLKKLEQRYSALRLRVGTILQVLRNSSNLHHFLEEHEHEEHEHHELHEYHDQHDIELEKHTTSLTHDESVWLHQLSYEALRLSHDYDRLNDPLAHRPAFINSHVQLGSREFSKHMEYDPHSHDNTHF